MNIVLSPHAIQRIIAREAEEGVVNLTMSAEEVLNLLSSGAFVKTEKKPVIGNKYDPLVTFWLFYSPADEACFIAVGRVNKAAQEHIIYTVIPASRRGKWSISQEKFHTARLLACKVIGFSPFTKAKQNPAPQSFKTTCSYTGINGRYYTTDLMKFPCEPYDGDVNKLIASEGFIQKCLDSFKGKGVNSSSITAIFVRMHKSDIPVVIDIREPVPSQKWQDA